MRETEFRGMDVEGNWHYGNLAVLPENIRHLKQGHYISNDAGLPFAYQVRPETVGQYTGLKDKKGKGIYEGDILKDPTGAGEIEWVQEHCAFMVFTRNPSKYHSLESDGKLFHSEVIGNIHSSPELLP